MNRAKKECIDKYNNERKSMALLAAIAPSGSPWPVFFWDPFLSCDGSQAVWHGAGGQGGYAGSVISAGGLVGGDDGTGWSI